MPSEYNSADNLTRPKTTDELFAKESNWFQPHPSFNQIEILQFHRMQVKKVLKKGDSKEVNSLKDLNELSAHTKATTFEIVSIMPEVRYQLEACTCQPISQSKLTKLCNECYRPHLDTEIELCAVGKKGNNSNDGEAPTTLKEALKHLDESYKKSKKDKVI